MGRAGEDLDARLAAFLTDEVASQIGTTLTSTVSELEETDRCACLSFLCRLSYLSHTHVIITHHIQRHEREPDAAAVHARRHPTHRGAPETYAEY